MLNMLKIFYIPLILEYRSQHFMSFFQNYKTFIYSKAKKLSFFSNGLTGLNFLLSDNIQINSSLETLTSNNVFVLTDYIKVQELTFLPEYFLITALFCITLFTLFSINLIVNKKHFSIKFQYSNQLVFLLIFVIICYLTLVYQQMSISLLSLASFNDTILNDQLSLISKFIIGISSIFYLMFTTHYLKDQKLNNFEYYIILLTSIFGFFLLCSANDLMTAYLAIELQGLAFYVLASFKKSSNFSIESGVKYFVLGSLSTAFFLLGITFIYGLSGSILFTDFKDFFIWVFSTNSFFLSFDSIFKSLDYFSNETVTDENSYLTKLQLISDKLNLLQQKASLLELEALTSNSNEFLTKTHDFNELNLIDNISTKMSELKSNINVIDEKILTISNVEFSINESLIEKNLQIAPVEFLNVLENNFSNISTIDNLKINLQEANFYEDGTLETFYSSSSQSPINENLITELQTNTNVIANNCLNSIYNLFDCCLLFGNIHNISFIDSILELDNNFLTSFDMELYLDSIFKKNFMLYYTSNICNLSHLFLDSNINTSEANFMFDFSLVTCGLLIILIALFFKLALAPFHLWSPDVYEGSPSSSTFFFMIISKFSIFVLLIRICYSSFYSFISYWQFYSLLIATVSIFVGAVAGLKQRRLKSLLTYSSINNMGFVLLAFSVGNFEGIQMNIYYLVVYMLSGLCVWSIILNLDLKKRMNSEKKNRDLGDLAMLNESNNVIAQNLGITLFTLAGLPPLVGFLAKMGVFKALTGVSIYFFSVTNILFSVIATFYYLRITKIIFFENLLIGNLYLTINSKKIFIINFLTFLLVFLFMSPMFLYFYSYKIVLFLNKSFY